MRKIPLACLAIMVVSTLVIWGCGGSQPTSPAKTAPATSAAPTSKPATTAPAATTAAPASKPAATTAAPAAAPVDWSKDYVLYTTQMGSISYAQFFSVQKSFEENKSRLKLSTKPSQGQYDRLQFLRDNPKEWSRFIVLAHPEDYPEVWKGVGTFEGYKFPDYRYILTYSNPPDGLVTYNSNIKTVKDLEGKKVAIGSKTQKSYGTAPAKIIEMAGVKCDIFWVGTAPAMEGLQDNKYDAAITLFTPTVKLSGKELVVDTSGPIYPDAALEQVLGGRRKLYAIDFTKEAIDKANAALNFGTMAFPMSIPAGTLGITPRDVWWWCEPAGFGAFTSMPDEVVREFLMGYVNWKEVRVRYVKAQEVENPPGYAGGITKDILHPAALKFFADMGWNQYIVQ